MRTDGHNGVNTAPKKPNERLVDSQLKLSLYRPGHAREGSRKLRLPEFVDNKHMKLTNLSALLPGRLYPQEISLLLITVRG
jgi:hypothetical protein